MFGWIVFSALFLALDCISIGTIANGRIVGSGGSNRFIHGNKQECLCAMNASNGSVAFLNVFQANSTCQLFSADTTPLRIDADPNCLVIIIDLSIMSFAIPPSVNGFWPFDGNAVDEQMRNNGVTVNNPNYVSPGITGRCCALQVIATANQSVQIGETQHLNLSFQSFTFQLWIYPYSLATNQYGDRGIIGQCQNLSDNLCLHISLRVDRIRMSFKDNACDGTRSISPFRWYHLTFVYDLSLSTQFTYIDGVPDCNHTSSLPLAISSPTPIPLTIGVTYPLAPFFFDGLIDQVSLFGYAKNATEIPRRCHTRAPLLVRRQLLGRSGTKQDDRNHEKWNILQWFSVSQQCRCIDSDLVVRPSRHEQFVILVLALDQSNHNERWNHCSCFSQQLIQRWPMVFAFPRLHVIESSRRSDSIGERNCQRHWSTHVCTSVDSSRSNVFTRQRS